MRHVILGSDTTLGSSILRVLVSIDRQEIVCCNPDGIIPTDVPTTNITTFNVDIRNIKMLEAIVQEDDILYNAQVFDNENVLSKKFDKLHVEGLKNLLKIANQKKVRKVISYIPQKISWEIPENADETTVLNPTTNYQKSLAKTLDTANQYFNQTLFESEKNHQEMESSTLNEDIQSEEGDDENILQDEKNSEGENEIEESNGVTDNEKNDSETITPKPPSLGPTPPVLNNVADDVESSDENNSKEPQEEEEEDEEELENEDEEELQLDIGYDVPLIVARLARFYGPFDYSITKKICQSVRLQRMRIVGKQRKRVSWINPLDAGRAMIIMGDNKVVQGQYNVNGFEATGSDLIEVMDNVNHSTTKIRRSLFLLSNISTKFKLVLSKLGVVNRINLDEIYGLNKTQVYSDRKAQEEWNWKPKYDVKSTSKDSLNWFVNHVL